MEKNGEITNDYSQLEYRHNYDKSPKDKAFTNLIACIVFGALVIILIFLCVDDYNHQKETGLIYGAYIGELNEVAISDTGHLEYVAIDNKIYNPTIYSLTIEPINKLKDSRKELTTDEIYYRATSTIRGSKSLKIYYGNGYNDFMKDFKK